MHSLNHKLAGLLRDESGQSLIEYSLIGAIVAVGCMVAMYLMRQQIQAVFNTITAAISYSM